MQLDYQAGCISYCFSLSVRCLGFACVPFPHHVPLPWLSHWPPRGVHYDFGDFPADRTGSIGRGRQLQVLQRRLHRVTVVAVNSLLLSLVFQRSISWFLASHLNRDDIWSFGQDDQGDVEGTQVQKGVDKYEAVLWGKSGRAAKRKIGMCL